MTMGTASTMASMVEALGVSLPGNAAIPAVDSRRYRLAQLSGRRIVEMVHEDLRAVEDPHAPGVRERHQGQCRHRRLDQFRGAPASHRRAGSASSSTLEDWDKLGSQLPCLVNLQPSGEFLMEDFYYAGGLPAVLQGNRERAQQATR